MRTNAERMRDLRDLRSGAKIQRNNNPQVERLIHLMGPMHVTNILNRLVNCAEVEQPEDIMRRFNHTRIFVPEESFILNA